MMDHVTHSDNTTVAFGGTKQSLRGQVLLLVSRGDTRCTLHCNLVEAAVRPLLGRKACIVMQLIKVLDSDYVNRPMTGVRCQECR